MIIEPVGLPEFADQRLRISFRLSVQPIVFFEILYDGRIDNRLPYLVAIGLAAHQINH